MHSGLYPLEFLDKQAISHKLTPSERVIFQLLYGRERHSKEQVMKMCHITTAKFQKRMGSIYRKFGVEGNTRGKRDALDSKLLALYNAELGLSGDRSESSNLTVDAIWKQLEPRIEMLIAKQLTVGEYPQLLSRDLVEFIDSNPEKFICDLRDSLRDDEISSHRAIRMLSEALPVWTDSFSVKIPYSEDKIIEAILNALLMLVEKHAGQRREELDSQDIC